MFRNLFLFLFVVLFSHTLYSQSACDSLTPSFIVDLSKDPNGTYLSPAIQRNGLCCNETGNVKCIEFVVTLNAKAEGILFTIPVGAVPSGALFYQVNCSSPTTVGEPLCLNGPGPHRITFCKPGNNTNQYSIQSVAEPVIPDSIAVNDGCSKEIGTIGFEESTIVWNSVFPDTLGAYNSYLNCSTKCDTVVVTPQIGYPPSIDYEVCGYPFGGCDSTYTCDTVRVNFFSTLDVNINPEFPTVCFGDSGTFISAIPSGGSPPYVYNWSTLETTQDIFVNTGTFWVELGDTSGCPPTYDTVVVTSFSLPIEAIAGNDTFSCIESVPISLNGNVISASGGTWFGNGTFNPSSDSLATTYSPDSTELANGKVNLKLVTTGNGTCPADTDVVQIDLLKFNANLTVDATPVSCKGDSDGLAWAIASGNGAPFSYQWDLNAGLQTTDSAINLPAGNYGVSIFDSAGCVLDTSALVIEADSILTVSITTTPVLCFNSNIGTANVIVRGGAPGYDIVWDPAISTFNGFSASGLAPGTYTVSVTDSFGCGIDTTFTIIGPSAPLAVTLTKVNVGCKNGNDGSATAIASGGTAPYTYLWDALTGFQSTATAVNLPKGLFSVQITDTNGCTISDTISLTEPPSSITFTDSTTKPYCFGGNDGTATVFPSGGTPPYTFLWDSLAGNQTTQTATGLSAGVYSVTIFDQNSCLFATPIEVIDPAPLFGTVVEIVHVSCKGGSNGSARVIPSGGTAPYTYQWDSLAGNQTDSIVTGLSAGIYGVYVFDQNGCSYLPGIEILEPEDSLIVNTNSVIVSCKGGNDGMAIGIPFGGTKPYSITWDNAAMNQTTDTATGLSSGNYVIHVVDSNGCIADSTVFVPEPATTLSTNLISLPTDCFEDSNGIAVSVPTGGMPPYVITWGSQTGNQTGDSATNLPAGVYQLNITDSTNCSLDTAIEVLQPLPLSLSGTQQDIFCFGENTGWAFISPSGGNSPYAFSWDSSAAFQTTDTAFNLSSGTYSVLVTDNKNCQDDSTFIISELSTPVLLNPQSIGITCFGDSNGLAIANASGGMPPFTYLWGTNASAQTTDTAFNLKVGTYVITATDSLGCSDNAFVNVEGPSSPLSMTLGKNNVRCFNGSDGMAFASASGGWPSYSYVWVSSTSTQSTDTAFSLNAEMVYLSLSDSNGCFITDSIEILEPSVVQLAIGPNDTICFGENYNIQLTPSGGNGAPFTYELLPGQVVNSPHNVSPSFTTVYEFKAFDQLGCESAVEQVQINVRNLAEDSLGVTKSGDLCLGDTVVVDAYHFGFYGPYTYEWNFSTDRLQIIDNPTASRSYVLKVTDGCLNSVKDSVFVNVYPRPSLGLDNEIAKGCVPLKVLFENKVADPSITSYEWDFGDGNQSNDSKPTYTYVDAGDYKIRLKVTNGFGCSSENDTESFVRAFAIPEVGFISNPAITDMRTPKVNFKSTSSIGSHYWQFEDTSTSNLRDPSHQYSDTGRYMVRLRVIDENGCEDSVSSWVIINPYFNLQVPNAFTPNTSGSSGGKYDPNGTNNYVFFPVTEGVSEYLLLIFNRWGELIFQSKDYKIGWDGYYRGKLSPQEVYVWKLVIQWENGQEYEGVGDVTLFR